MTRSTDAVSTRARVLALLRTTERPMTTAELADELAIHANTVRFHLDTLVARGQAEQIRTAPEGPGRPAVRVRAVTGMDPDGPRHYRVLAEALAHGLAAAPDPAEQARQAGHAWGGARVTADEPARADPVPTLLRMLDDLDFEPSRLGATEIGLRNCPFLELTGSAREVVCSVHLGLMRGTLEALGGDVEVTALEPFARPNLCLVHLAKEGSSA